MARKIEVEIVGDSSSLERAFRRSSNASSDWRKSIERASRGGIVATVGFRGLGRSVAFASGAFLGGAGFVAVAKNSVQAASDLNEQLNKSNVLFGNSAGQIKEWSETTATSFGISQRAALEAAGAFGSILETAGLTQSKAADFSKTLVQLASDMASFNNIDPGLALEKIRSGLAGEAEPLRTVGVLLSEARVKQEAYRSGLAKSGATLTEQQKVLARYNLILQDTAKQQGDFQRTSGGLANQQRILAAQIDNLQAKLGTALLPSVLSIVTALNKWLASSENQKRLQQDVNEVVGDGKAIFAGFREVINDLVPIVRGATDAVGGLKNAVKLLLTVFVVAKVVSFAQAITGVGVASKGATTQVNILRLALLRLGAIGVITLGVEVVLNRKAINEKVKGFLDSHGLGFFTGEGDFKLPEIKLGNIEKFIKIRDQVAALPSSPKNEVLLKTLDKIIAKLERIRSIKLGKLPDEVDRLVNATRGSVGGIPDEGRLNTKGTNITAGRKKLTDKLLPDPNAFSKFLQKLFRSFDLAIDRAQLTKPLNDDLAVLQKQLAVVNELLAKHRGNLELQERQVQIEGQILDIQNQQVEAAKAAAAAAKQAREEATQRAIEARKSSQFQALGLTSSGEQRTPSAAALAKRAGSLASAVKGTVLDTQKTRNQLRSIAKVLSGAFGAVGKDVRAAILQMLNDISSALEDKGGKVGNLTKTTSLNTNKILAGLDLSGADARTLKARLSNFNSGGLALAGAQNVGSSGGFFVVEATTNVNLDGQKVASNTTRHQQKSKRRNPRQKRGPHRRD